MPNLDQPYLKELLELLPQDKNEKIFLCIRDLVANGIDTERFANETYTPQRQEATQYIASWFKYIGLSADDCREWMISYCVGMLSVISTSSKSQIRHSTKSNIKYIFRSGATFDCGCESNRFKAACATTCPVYEEMTQKAEERKKATIEETYRVRAAFETTDVFVPKSYSVKEQYKEQFAAAMTFAKEQLEQGVKKKDIVKLLNEKEFKTRTGKTWAYTNLSTELKKLDSR